MVWWCESENESENVLTSVISMYTFSFVGVHHASFHTDSCVVFSRIYTYTRAYLYSLIHYSPAYTLHIQHSVAPIHPTAVLTFMALRNLVWNEKERWR